MGCTGSQQVDYVEIVPRCSAPEVDFAEETITLNGAVRNTAAWLPKDGPIKAVVLASHGLNEHCLRFYGIAIELAKVGFAVHAIDHASHGKSDGKRGVIADHRVMYNDFIAFGQSVKKKYPTMPLFLLAHSMGTLVGLMSINSIADIQAVVLSGPAIFAGPGASSPFGIRCLYPLSQTAFAECLTSVTSVIDPGGPAAPLVVQDLTSDAAELEINRTDPRVAPPVVTNKSAYEVVKLIAAAKKEIPLVKVPLELFKYYFDGVSYCIVLYRIVSYHARIMYCEHRLFGLRLFTPCTMFLILYLYLLQTSNCHCHCH
jgi:acylglycerol lipase